MGATMLTGDEYQHKQLLSMGTSTRSEEWIDASLIGMQAALGGLADLVAAFRWNDADMDPIMIQRHIGMILWHAALLCNATGLRLSTVMVINLARIRAIRPTGAVPAPRNEATWDQHATQEQDAPFGPDEQAAAARCIQDAMQVNRVSPTEVAKRLTWSESRLRRHLVGVDRWTPVTLSYVWSAIWDEQDEVGEHSNGV